MCGELLAVRSSDEPKVTSYDDRKSTYPEGSIQASRGLQVELMRRGGAAGQAGVQAGEVDFLWLVII